MGYIGAKYNFEGNLSEKKMSNFYLEAIRVSPQMEFTFTFTS